jgi:TrpR-related protein YerC/YecD
MDLLEALLLLRTKDEAYRFLKDLLTPQEFSSFEERWKVCQLLDEGKLSYRDIHQKSGVSVVTIGRVARFLNDESYQGYRLILDRFKEL